MDTLACAEATCLWLTKKFANCQATLQKLESEGKLDLKVGWFHLHSPVSYSSCHREISSSPPPLAYVQLSHNLLVAEHAVVGSAEADRIASQLELIAVSLPPWSLGGAVDARG